VHSYPVHFPAIVRDLCVNGGGGGKPQGRKMETEEPHDLAKNGGGEEQAEQRDQSRVTLESLYKHQVHLRGLQSRYEVGSSTPVDYIAPAISRLDRPTQTRTGQCRARAARPMSTVPVASD
jgi:hypothetical protein